MIQAAYTAEALAAFASSPQDRAEGVRAILQTLGCRLESFDFCLGEYDVVVIYEAPDDTTAAAVTLAASTPGYLKALKTTKLLSNDEMMEAMRKASRLRPRADARG